MTGIAILALADGSYFIGKSVGADGLISGEVVFNTSMTGYQEILTDPSYTQQIVALTYPHIGNTGTNSEDEESSKCWANGLIIRDLAMLASNWRNQEDLPTYLKRNNVVSIADIDTRRLTRILREKGAQNGCIIAGDNVDQKTAIEAALAGAKAFPGLKGMDLAKEVTTNTIYSWNQGTWVNDDMQVGYTIQSDINNPYRVVAYDFGIKRNISRMLSSRGCALTIVPADTPASDVIAMKPDGVFLSNGPGDPEPCDYAITAIKHILAETNLPMFGICLGHQLLSLASGATPVKMKFGHHGANHPVIDIEKQQVLITSQNHGFAIDEQSLPNNLQVTHKSLFDGSLQGVRRTDKPAFGFQGHPEASPGPHDVGYLFDEFIELIKAYKAQNKH
jgi:carbamoyl-phosphate synthase small subunit